MFQAYKVAKDKKLAREDKHNHNHGEYDMFHDGPGGHPHDEDGHVHQDHFHESLSSYNKFHDGPGGHHHDNDGHIHESHVEADQSDGHTHQKTKNDEAISSTEEESSNDIEDDNQNLRDITLTISKLLFHLSNF